MKMKLNPVDSAIYITLQEGTVSASESIGSSVVVDYDDNNKVMGLELLLAAGVTPSQKLNAVALIQLLDIVWQQAKLTPETEFEYYEQRDAKLDKIVENLLTPDQPEDSPFERWWKQTYEFANPVLELSFKEIAEAAWRAGQQERVMQELADQAQELNLGYG